MDDHQGTTECTAPSVAMGSGGHIFRCMYPPLLPCTWRNSFIALGLKDLEGRCSLRGEITRECLLNPGHRPLAMLIQHHERWIIWEHETKACSSNELSVSQLANRCLTWPWVTTSTSSLYAGPRAWPLSSKRARWERSASSEDNCNVHSQPSRELTFCSTPKQITQRSRVSPPVR